MGYQTDFTGSFEFDKPLTVKDKNFLTKFNETRRMARNIEGYGVEGEFYVDGANYNDSNVIDGNRPPKTQPGLWCQWAPTDDGRFLEWDGGEKFYNYVEWLEYLITNIIEPRGYKLNGEVQWQGEDSGDVGKIVVKDNMVVVLEGHVVFGQQTSVSNDAWNAINAAMMLAGFTRNGASNSSNELGIVYKKGDVQIKITVAGHNA